MSLRFWKMLLGFWGAFGCGLGVNSGGLGCIARQFRWQGCNLSIYLTLV